MRGLVPRWGRCGASQRWSLPPRRIVAGPDGDPTEFNVIVGAIRESPWGAEICQTSGRLLTP